MSDQEEEIKLPVEQEEKQQTSTLEINRKSFRSH